MCTLLTITKKLYKSKAIRQIMADADFNYDGFALLTVSKDGDASLLRTMSIETILAVLDERNWSRMFLHSRAATQGDATLKNCHGWETNNGTFYMHNGILHHPDAKNFAVDSQLIGHWLNNEGIDATLKHLMEEAYANVFLVHPESNWYTVSRSLVGSLYTDGLGNFSTNQFGDITIPVVDNAWETFDIFKKMPALKVADFRITADGISKETDDILDQADLEYLADLNSERFNDDGGIHRMTDDEYRDTDSYYFPGQKGWR